MAIEDNAKELALQNIEMALGYYKRFITSISVASGAGLAALLSFISVYQGKESVYLSSVLPSLWGFTIALVFSGVTPYFLYLSYSGSGESLRIHHNRNELEKMLLDEGIAKAKVSKIFPKDTKEDSGWFWHKTWWYVSRITLLISALSFLTGLIYPIFLITFKGNLV